MRMATQFAGTSEIVEISLSGVQVRLVVETSGPEHADLCLLLPALSTVSSRGEWRTFATAIGDRYRLVSFDWPGFGDSDRPRIRYDVETLRTTLNAVLDHLKSTHKKKITVVAVGHSAPAALSLADERSLEWDRLVLVAPTWRGPLPTMTGWTPEQFKWLRQLVSLPVLGSMLYRLNTSRTILKLMLRRHVWVNPEMLNPEIIREQQLLSRKKGARFASVSFVSGGFDPDVKRTWWLEQAKLLKCPLHVVLATEAPPRSKEEMTYLAELADEVSEIKGRLGLHQEYGKALAEWMVSA